MFFDLFIIVLQIYNLYCIKITYFNIKKKKQLFKLNSQLRKPGITVM